MTSEVLFLDDHPPVALELEAQGANESSQLYEYAETAQFDTPSPDQRQYAGSFHEDTTEGTGLLNEPQTTKNIIDETPVI